MRVIDTFRTRGKLLAGLGPARPMPLAGHAVRTLVPAANQDGWKEF